MSDESKVKSMVNSIQSEQGGLNGPDGDGDPIPSRKSDQDDSGHSSAEYGGASHAGASGSSPGTGRS